MGNRVGNERCLCLVLSFPCSNVLPQIAFATRYWQDEWDYRGAKRESFVITVTCFFFFACGVSFRDTRRSELAGVQMNPDGRVVRDQAARRTGGRLHACAERFVLRREITDRSRIS